MATFKIDYFSNALHRMASFEMWIPNDVRTDVPPEPTPYNQRPMKTLFVLHGYTGKAENHKAARYDTADGAHLHTSAEIGSQLSRRLLRYAAYFGKWNKHRLRTVIVDFRICAKFLRLVQKPSHTRFLSFQIL